MGKELVNVLYAVVILNYNTINDAISAADSVKANAEVEDYIICIADNASSKEEDHNICKNYSSDHVETICLKKNTGYASGNNNAIRCLLKVCKPEYIVIMNPDVLILEHGTIEKMIQRIKNHGNNVIGGQPLVWNCYNAGKPEYQQNIRMVPTFADICIQSLLPLKVIFSRRYKKTMYADSVPYKSEMEYLVPSGAFFVINANEFKLMDFFDEGTFLYYEEHILGKKIEMAGNKMLFMPEFKVRHEHGKSTGSNHYSTNKFSKKCLLESRLYYAKKYLNTGKLGCAFIKFLNECNAPFQYMKIWFARIKQSNR